ncbi:MAG: hypothetical protein ACLP3C_17475 [Mycobacterium sp.]
MRSCATARSATGSTWLARPSGVNNPATVHGAVLSGQYAAAELMRRLR